MTETKTKTMYNGELVEGMDVPIIHSNENWSDYELEDGSKIRVRFVVGGFVRLNNQYDTENNPVYAIKGNLVALPTPPEKLRKRE